MFGGLSADHGYQHLFAHSIILSGYTG